MKKIAVFGSGSGTNAENIIRHFKLNPKVQIGPLVSNTSKSRFKEIAKTNGIEYLEYSNQDFAEFPEKILADLNSRETEWIILAGFLRKIHPDLIRAFSNKMINIHPSLLPKYGGKGMYGMKVHQAVFENNDSESGITVHFVNENFDEGKIIEQRKVNVSSCQTPDEIRGKVQELEQLVFPEIIESVIL
ncbi:MAG: phosphoribosylglycinamide formyltransferase [Crocinitomicaceae bacterium]|nr:phosphoribosylglycinamide formyltransferase [Crocinitomicaceae bacterium]